MKHHITIFFQRHHRKVPADALAEKVNDMTLN